MPHNRLAPPPSWKSWIRHCCALNLSRSIVHIYWAVTTHLHIQMNNVTFVTVFDTIAHLTDVIDGFSF